MTGVQELRGGERERTEVTECNATALRKASRKISAFYDAALEGCGLRTTQYAILAELGRRDVPPTLRELADALVLDRSGLGHNLRPLERDALVAMEQDGQDRRRRHIVLTDAGVAKLAEGRRRWRTAQDAFARIYGHGEAEELRRLLNGIAYDDRFR